MVLEAGPALNRLSFVKCNITCSTSWWSDAVVTSHALEDVPFCTFWQLQKERGGRAALVALVVSISISKEVKLLTSAQHNLRPWQ